MMKNLLYTFIIAILIIGCATTQNTTDSGNTSTEAGDTIRIANDSLEYEIIIIEPGFNTWLLTQPPRGYYEQFWLENRNIIRVNEYNRRVANTSVYDPQVYIQPIEYRSTLDYGYEVNYLLYNWFEFFEERYNQKLR